MEYSSFSSLSAPKALSACAQGFLYKILTELVRVRILYKKPHWSVRTMAFGVRAPAASAKGMALPQSPSLTLV